MSRTNILDVFMCYHLSYFFCELIFRLTQPFILRSMIRSFSADARSNNEDEDEIKKQQYLFTGVLIFVTLVYALNIHHIYKGIQHMAMKGRIACSSVIYRKVSPYKDLNFLCRYLLHTPYVIIFFSADISSE